MLRNEPLICTEENPVSPFLLENLREAQNVLHCWNRNFRKIPVRAQVSRPSAPTRGTASMFSGGVDSIHVLARHRAVDEVVFIGGFDFDVGSAELMEATSRNRHIAGLFGKRVGVVHSNQKAWGMETGVARNFWHSAYLAASALFFGYREVLIPAGHTYAELNPIGCHPVLDSLWSNGTTTFRHVDRDCRRSEKIRNIIDKDGVLDALHVCWNDPTRNCGRCEKCLRTMVTLDILGVRGPFPRRATLAEIAKLRADNWDGLSFLIDNALLASELGKTEELRSLKRALRRHDREQALEYFDWGVLGGFLHRLRKRIRPYRLREGLTNGRPDTLL